jgi:hypothetical protein
LEEELGGEAEQARDEGDEEIGGEAEMAGDEGVTRSGA